MNMKIAIVFASCMVAHTVGLFFDPISITTGAAAAGTAAAAATGSTLFISSAGVALGAAGLLGAAAIKGALIGSLLSRRGRRSAEEHVTRLTALDAYFQAVADMDVDDCGKKYVCEIEMLEQAQRTPEEALVATLFGDEPLDPTSPKAEYDLAAFLGQTTRSKNVCARRYQRCPVDRKTISQAFAKNRQ
eukprot:TRINITY_DN3214_c0_g1_i1.p1 TRINITY_DN3214_c0_g1~~TRINITY_DN3214_c0_g1_i1.p1  ORF type:complete len:189 (+),score=57.61 TRINITY_DN3214_c0_g1_i1:46-612(+)